MAEIIIPDEDPMAIECAKCGAQNQFSILIYEDAALVAVFCNKCKSTCEMPADM